ncbi:GumC family protein [Paracoccus sp. (in: a-proteobacteria)]|uniref:GumC family protein n=1 Tax=Paracoccus sp. TaxID=267 RepID=UPI00396CB0A1
MIRRRGPIMALILVGGIYAALSYAMSLPRAYEAVTVVQIEPTLLSGGLGTDAAAGTASRLRLIEQRLMARSNVLSIIDLFGLYDDASELNEDEQIALFRQNVRIEFIPAAGVTPGMEGGLSAMLISVRTGRAADAANLANHMADQILTSDQTTRTQRLADLIDTLRQEDARVSAAISEVQARMTAFRSDHPDYLPGTAETLAGEQSRLEGQRAELIRSLQALERERLALEVGTGVAGSPSVPQQLRTLEVDLAQARRTLSPGHPEIQRLESLIDNLRQGDQQQLAPGVLRQITLIQEQEAALNADRMAVERRLPQIEAAIAAIPRVTADLDDFTREISELQITQTAIAERLSRAQLDQRLVANDHGERMVVLEPAVRPEYPIDSGRKRVVLMGLVGSLGAALAVAFLLELLRPVLRTPDQVRKALGVDPIALSPWRPSPREVTWRMTRDIASVGILVLGCIAVVSMISAPTI